MTWRYADAFGLLDQSQVLEGTIDLGDTKGTNQPPQGPAPPPPPTLAQRVVAFYKALPGGALLFAVVPLLLLGYFGWYYWGSVHLDRTLYSLQLEKLHVTSQPPWIRTSVREEVFHNGSLSHVSLLDPQATATIAHAFTAHTWVQQTSRVQKHPDGSVHVDLIYREPAALVHFSPNSHPNTNQVVTGEIAKEGYFPIDSEGIVLPTDEYSEELVLKYFRIYAPGAVPAGDVGMAFGDTRISDALLLCKLLKPRRSALGLGPIYVLPDTEVGARSPWSLTLVTKDNREILWGHAPGKESLGEPSVADKFAKLERWLTATPTQASGGSQDSLDLRTRPTSSGRLIKQ